MDPLTIFGVAGAGYLLFKPVAATTLPPVVPQTVLPPPVIPPKSFVPSPEIATGLGAISGAAIGALIGGQIGVWAVQSVSQYDAPITKATAVPVFTAVGAITGGIIGGIVLKVGVLAACSFGVIVAVVFVAVYAVFIVAVIIEDTVRYNEWQKRYRSIMRLVKDKRYKAALAEANQGATDGFEGLGFRLKPFAVDYSGTGATKAAFGYGGNEFGLEPGFVIPALFPGDYEGIFGVDAEMLTMNNGAPLNVKDTLIQSHLPMRVTVDGFVKKNLRQPTFDEYEVMLDTTHDEQGVSLREYRDASTRFGYMIAPGFPWVPASYFAAWEPSFSLTHDEQVQAQAQKIVEEAATKAATNTVSTVAPQTMSTPSNNATTDASTGGGSAYTATGSTGKGKSQGSRIDPNSL